MGFHTPVESHLNITAWHLLLPDYWGQQLLDLLEFSFQLDFNRTTARQSTQDNHTSAQEFSDHIEGYIQEQIQYSGMYSSFVQKPFPAHISTLMTIAKQTSDKRRAIIDPQGVSPFWCQEIFLHWHLFSRTYYLMT